MSPHLGPDSAIHRVMSWIGALVVANVVGVVLGLPLITIGLSLLVMATVSILLVENETTAILPAIRLALRGTPVAIVTFLMEAGLSALLVWEWLISDNLISTRAVWVLRGILVFIAVVLAVAHVWIWPLLAHRLIATGTLPLSALPALLKVSLLVGVARLPYSAIGLVVLGAPLAVALVSPQWALRVIFYLLIFGTAFGTYVCVLITESTLRTDAETSEEATLA